MYKFFKHDLGYNNLQDTYIHLPIPIDQLHSPFDHEHMWKYEKTRMHRPHKECGCYTTKREDEHEHYTNTTINSHYCPEHYTEYLAEEERKLQHDMDIKIQRDTCTENILALAKNKQQNMTHIIQNITVPFLKCLNDALPDNMVYHRKKSGSRYITGYFKNNVTNDDHTCTCKYNLSFNKIKCKKIAKKTFKFDIRDPSTLELSKISFCPPNYMDYIGNIGKITIRHCQCHRKNWHSSETFKLKSLEL